MGFFDFLKPAKKSGMPPELEAQMKFLSTVTFPRGQQQIEEETDQLFALLQGKINRDESKMMLCRTKGLLVIAEDKSAKRITTSILMNSGGKLNETDASMVYQFLTGISGDVYSGGDGSSTDQAVVIRAANSIAGIDAEYKWIENKYGKKDNDWKVFSRIHGTDNTGKSYETYDIELKTGSRVTITFDITAFYGRF